MDLTGFLLGLLLGGAFASAALVIVGSLIRSPLSPHAESAVAATLMSAFVLREAHLISFPLPQNARLVPQFVTRVHGWGALQFGAEMGTGMRTYSPTGLPHVLAVAIFFLSSWQEALVGGAGFAIGRAVMVLTFLLARDKEMADQAFDRLLPRLQWVLLIGFVPLALALPMLSGTSSIRYSAGALLGAAVVGKLRSLSEFRRSLASLGLYGRSSQVVTGLVLATEVVVVALLFSPCSLAVVAALLTGLGVIFTAVQTFLLVGAIPQSCACFGVSEPASPSLGLVRAVLILAGGLVLLVAAGLA